MGQVTCTKPAGYFMHLGSECTPCSILPWSLLERCLALLDISTGACTGRPCRPASSQR